MIHSNAIVWDYLSDEAKAKWQELVQLGLDDDLAMCLVEQLGDEAEVWQMEPNDE